MILLIVIVRVLNVSTAVDFGCCLGKQVTYLRRETVQQSAIILIYYILKYHGGGPENKSALSAVLKPYYLRFAFWKKKLRLNYQLS